MKVMNGLDLQSQKIIALADPSANTDAANKQYVDNVARGLMWKAPVRAASTTTITTTRRRQIRVHEYEKPLGHLRDPYSSAF